jgi:hypothetical protein
MSKRKLPTEFERWTEAVEVKTYTKGCQAIAKYLFIFLERTSLLLDEDAKEEFRAIVEHLLKVHLVHTAVVDNPGEECEILVQNALNAALVKLSEWEGAEFPQTPDGFPFIGLLH